MNQNQYYKKRYAPNDEKIICHVSNFRKVKRIGDVIKTFNIVAENIKSKLILVGDGPVFVRSFIFIIEQSPFQYHIS